MTNDQIYHYLYYLLSMNEIYEKYVICIFEMEY